MSAAMMRKRAVLVVQLMSAASPLRCELSGAVRAVGCAAYNLVSACRAVAAVYAKRYASDAARLIEQL
jgi:hypothetical protein